MPFRTQILYNEHDHLQKHCADECHPLVDWGATEDVSSTKRQGDVLYHVSEKLEVLHVADEVQRVVHRRQAHKNVLQEEMNGTKVLYPSLQKRHYVRAESALLVLRSFADHEVGQGRVGQVVSVQLDLLSRGMEASLGNLLRRGSEELLQRFQIFRFKRGHVAL